MYITYLTNFGQQKTYDQLQVHFKIMSWVEVNVIYGWNIRCFNRKSSSSSSVSWKPYLSSQSLSLGSSSSSSFLLFLKKNTFKFYVFHVRIIFRNYMDCMDGIWIYVQFYSWNFQFRTLHMEFIHIESRPHGISLNIMWFVQLFRLTSLLEGAPCVDLLIFLGGGAVVISSSSSLAFLFNLSSFHFSSSSFFLSSSSSLSHSFLFLSSPSLLLICTKHLLGSTPLSLPSPVLSHPVNEREN